MSTETRFRVVAVTSGRWRSLCEVFTSAAAARVECERLRSAARERLSATVYEIEVR